MAIFQVVAPVYKIEPKKEGVSQKSGNPWCSQTVVLDCSTTGQLGQLYMHYLSVDFFGAERVALLNGLQLGSNVQVSFTVESRERVTQSGATFWSTSANGINIKPFVQQQSTPQQPQQPYQGQYSSQPQQQPYPAQHPTQPQQTWHPQPQQQPSGYQQSQFTGTPDSPQQGELPF